MKKSFMGPLFGFLLIIAVVGIGTAFLAFNKHEEGVNVSVLPNDGPIQTPLNKEPVGFSWKFEEAKTLNLDSNPQTNLYVEIKYPNDEVESKLVATTDGSCNELPEADKDSFSNTTNVQCYYAGFGYRFKIVKRDNAYLVEQQEFEEGTPDYDPPTQQYKVVTEIPF
jgi:hypothetical protein